LAVPFGGLAVGHLLDIDSNTGCNSIHAAPKYQFSTTGVDITPLHIEAARFLAALAGASFEFELAGGEMFSRFGEFDVELHFGDSKRLSLMNDMLTAVPEKLRRNKLSWSFG
jgi:hypothetical protein